MDKEPVTANPPLHLLATFSKYYPDLSPEWIVQAPGRQTWIAAALGDAQSFTFANAEQDSRTSFSYQSAKQKRTLLKRPLPSWARYPAGVIVELCTVGMDLGGIYAAVLGDESFGPRYNHALGMAVAALWHEIHQRPYSADSLLEIVERVRREYVEG